MPRASSTSQRGCQRFLRSAAFGVLVSILAFTSFRVLSLLFDAHVRHDAVIGGTSREHPAPRPFLRQSGQGDASEVGFAIAQEQPVATSTTVVVTARAITGCEAKEIVTAQLATGLVARACPTRGAHSSPLFVAVTSPVANFNLRKELRRKLWLFSAFPPLGRASYLFVVGRGRDEGVRRKIEQEMKEHGDILAIDLPDTYMNLAVKSAAAAAWFDTQVGSTQGRFFMKVEDFMTVDFGKIDGLVQELSKKPNQERAYYGGGMIFGGTPVVPDGRWGCPERHCPYKTYPNEYAGGMYLLNAQAAHLVAAEGLPALNLKDPYPIEDHYVATVLARNHIKLTNDPRLLWKAGDPYGAPSVAAGDYLLCLDTEDRPNVGEGEAGTWEGNTLILPKGTKLHQAWYGDPEHPWSTKHGKDVSESVQKAFAKEGHRVRAWDSKWGDPAPGTRKILIVKIDP